MENKNKENAYSDYMKEIMHSWTWEKLTEKERDTFDSAVATNTLFGTYSQRVEQMQGYYFMFLSALGYSPIGWREKMENKNKETEIETAREYGRKEAAKFIVDALIAYDENGNIREIIDIIAKKFGVSVDADY